MVLVKLRCIDSKGFFNTMLSSLLRLINYDSGKHATDHSLNL